MNGSDEKAMFDLMDQLEKDQLTDIDDVQCHDGDAKPDADTLRRLKDLTWAKLGDPPAPAAPAAPAAPQPVYRKRRKYWIASIVTAAAIVLTVTLGFSSEVQAELKKLLKFIPGLGIVQEETSSQSTYVLDKPVTVTAGDGQITVEGVMFQDHVSSVSLSGENARQIHDFELSTDDGKKYHFKVSTLSSSIGSWQGGYISEKPVILSPKSEITLRFQDMSIGPFKLTQAAASDTQQGLGPSAEHNGVLVTAIPADFDEDKARINLLSKLPDGWRIDSYGKEPITDDIRLMLLNRDDKEIPLVQNKSFVHISELLYQKSLVQSGQTLALNIPSIRVIDMKAPESRVSLPLPAIGESVELHETVALAGFPVAFTKIERTSADNVRINVNLHLDTTKKQSLQGFIADMKNPDGNQGYSWRINEQSRAIEELNLPVNTDRDEITFYLKEPRIVVQGPWNMSWKTP